MTRWIALLLLFSLKSCAWAAPSATIVSCNGKDAVLQDLQTANASATDNGVWVDFQCLSRGDIEVVLSATGTVQLRGSNAQSRPANTVDGTQIGLDITASGHFDLTNPPSWVKAKITANSGTITVRAMMRGR